MSSNVATNTEREAVMVDVLSSEDLERSLALEERCHRCGLGPRNTACSLCHGRGRIITSFGQDVLDFVFKHLDERDRRDRTGGTEP